MKRCSKCNQSKSITEFNKRKSSKDGLQPYCKLCQGNYQKSKEGKAARKRYDRSEKGKVNHQKRDKKYYKTEKGKVNCRARQKRYYARHPNQIKAQRIVNKAIREDRLSKPDTLQCHYCPVPAIEYHHYKGYEPEHWLDVVPVCTKCHYKCNRKVA